MKNINLMENKKENFNISKTNVKTIAGFLVTALDLEDRVSGGVYREYLDFNNWPNSLDREAFLIIKDSLSILINDTEEHKRKFSNLQKKLKNNDKK